jgi:competence protein ComEC
MRAGQTIDLGGGVTLTALWPVDNAMNGVNAGLVLKLRYAGRTVLFTGDVGEPAEQALSRRLGGMSADVLIAPHQGNSDASSADFIAAADPAIVLSSDATELTAKQLRFADAVENRPLLRTGQCGAITITIHSDGAMSVESFLRIGQNGSREFLAFAAGQRRADAHGGR